MKSRMHVSYIMACVVAFVGIAMQANSQQVFSNGIDLAYGAVSNLGLVKNAGSSTNLSVVGQAASIAQMAGGNPETGQMITNANDLLQYVGSSLVIVNTNGNEAVGISGQGIVANSIAAGSISSGPLYFYDGTNYIGTIGPSNGMLNVSGGLNGDAKSLMIDGEPIGSIISNIQQKVDAAYSVKASIVVESVGTNAVANGTSLLAAYDKAVALSPSSSNRVVVVVPPGRYDLGTQGLNMYKEYIDLVGQTSDRSAQYIYGTPGSGNGVIRQTADHVRIENLTVENTIVFSSSPNSTIPAAYFPTVSGANTVVRNCVFTGTGGGYFSLSTRLTDYYGHYEDCVVGPFSFGFYSSAYGTFINCSAGDWSFGTAGKNAIGTFIDCSAGDSSFGYGGTASGTFINCSAGASSFGTILGANSTFINCAAGTGSFGNGPPTFPQGIKFVNCSAGSGSFAGFQTASENFNYNESGYEFFGGHISGDGAGLTNLNIPDGSIGADKVSSDVVTVDVLTNGVLDALAVSRIIGQNGSVEIQGSIVGDGSGLTNLPVQVDVDTDMDGIPDWYENQHRGQVMFEDHFEDGILDPEWVMKCTYWEEADGKLKSVPEALPGFNYGHSGDGRGTWVVLHEADTSWVDYSYEFTCGVSGVDPALNPHGLPVGYIKALSPGFRIKELPASWNDPARTKYGFTMILDNGAVGDWSFGGNDGYYIPGTGWHAEYEGTNYKFAEGNCSAINPGTQENHVRIMVQGNDAYAWINDVFVGKRTDSNAISAYGGIALNGGSWESMAWYDDVIVRSVGLDPNVPDADLDYDNDGFTNLEEYQNDTDPMDSENGVGWSELNNIPAVVSDGQIDWSELSGTPAVDGDLDMNGNKIINLGDAVLDTDAASQGHVKTMMQQVPGYGDIPMGEFTSQVAMPDRPAGPGLMVNAGEVALGAVDTDALADYAVTTEKLDDNAVTTEKLADGSVTADKIATNSISSDKFVPNIGIVPSGAIMAWPSQQLPAGWLECDGQELSISNNPALYSVIGTAYGGNAAQDKFNLPDYRGYFLRGLDNGAGRDPDASARLDRGDGSSGDVVGSVQAEGLKAHSHKVREGVGGTQTNPVDGCGFSGMDSSAGFYVGSSTTNDLVESTGGSETRPVNVNVIWIIKQ